MPRLAPAKGLRTASCSPVPAMGSEERNPTQGHLAHGPEAMLPRLPPCQHPPMLRSRHDCVSDAKSHGTPRQRLLPLCRSQRRLAPQGEGGSSILLPRRAGVRHGLTCCSRLPLEIFR